MQASPSVPGSTRGGWNRLRFRDTDTAACSCRVASRERDRCRSPSRELYVPAIPDGVGRYDEIIVALAKVAFHHACRERTDRKPRR